MNCCFRFRLLILTFLLGRLSFVVANPSSKAYVPFRTNPFDTASGQHRVLVWDDENTLNVKSTVRYYQPDQEEAAKKECPFQFSLGVSSSSPGSASVSASGVFTAGDSIVSAAAKAFGIIQPPVIFPIHPSQGPGRQVLYTTQYEHLDLLSPITVNRNTGGKGGSKEDTVIKEGLAQVPDFPLLFESSSFLTPPLLHDVNGDGIPDAILSDYDGGIYMIGLYAKPGTKRYFHRAQVPRLFVRRNWVEERLKEASPTPEVKNETHDDSPRDPYHSYFEYTYHDGTKPRGDILQGVTANVLGQDTKDLKGLTERRGRLVKHDSKFEVQEVPRDQLQLEDHSDQHHRRLQEASGGGKEGNVDQNLPFVTDEKKKSESTLHQAASEAVDTSHVDEPKHEPAVISVDGTPEELPKEEADASKESPQKQEVAKLESEGDAQKPALVDSNEEQAPNTETKQQVTDTEVQKQLSPAEVHKILEEAEAEKIGTDAETQREVTRVESQKPLLDSAQKNQLNAGEVDLHTNDSSKSLKLKTGNSNNGNEGGAQHLIPEASGDVDPTAKSGKEYDKAWEQVRGGEGGGGNWDDPSPGHDDKAPVMKNEDAGDDYKRYPKDDEVRAYGGYDDYAGDRMAHVRERESYYDDKHYVRIPPHILASPVVTEVPKQYDSNNAVEELLLIPVSYYMDEDEYDGLFSYKRFEPTDHGDETEVKRGMYVASALMVYSLGDSPRWGRQEHLDLSTDATAPENATLMEGSTLLEDKTRMGAFAFSSPTVADIDGDGSSEVLMGTSMGMVYCLEARHLYSKDGWPVQMLRPVESRILVEDVLGDTNLEVFVADVGGNIVCLDHKANKLWHRNIPRSLGIDGNDVTSFSPMTLGDVDGDGNLDLVFALGITDAEHSETIYIFVLSAATGADIANFPIAFKPKKQIEKLDVISKKIPQPLLVDLHGDQSHLKSFLYRNGTTWLKRKQGGNFPSVSHGGRADGLHIVAPLGSTLYIVEAGSGCTQSIEIGDNIEAMVQADDVHGTNSLDLVVSTSSGNVITLESPAPFHPLNTWNHGEVRGSKNSFAHGYSASQGIFVHETSRQFRDIFGIYVPVTFEIFDNRPGISRDSSKRVYQVEVRDGTSTQRPILRRNYNATGVYTERVYIPYGPGFYTLTVVLKTSHGLTYEDSFHLGYNVHYMDGFGVLLWLPLVAAAICIVICGRKQSHWDDDEFGANERSGQNLGILGRATLPTNS